MLWLNTGNWEAFISATNGVLRLSDFSCDRHGIDLFQKCRNGWLVAAMAHNMIVIHFHPHSCAFRNSDSASFNIAV